MLPSLLATLTTYQKKMFGAKGNRAFADLRYGEEDSISPSTLIVAATKGLLWI